MGDVSFVGNDGVCFDVRILNVAARSCGRADVQAVLCQSLALHQSIERDGWTITHVPTGYAVIKGERLKWLSVPFLRLCKTLSQDQWDSLIIGDAKKAKKNRLLKKIYKYLAKSIECESREDLEKMVGVFYADRYAAEKMRIAINPEKNTILDSVAFCESMIGDVLMGKVELPEGEGK